jgi:hypothetical protein
MRITSYHNSFLPVIRGAIVPAPHGSDIRLLMTLHPAVAVFMAVWLCGVGGPVAAALVHWPPASIPRVPAAMLVFGVALTVIGFFPETAKAETIIRECLGAAQQGDGADERRPG